MAGKKKSTTGKASKKRRVKKDVTKGVDFLDHVHTSSGDVEELPGGIFIDNPVGAPHLDPPPLPEYALEEHERPIHFSEVQPEVSYDDDDDDEDEDLHSLWEEREEQHSRKTMRMTAVVATTMVAIIGIWMVSVSSSVRSFASVTSNVGNVKEDFLNQLDSYDQRLEELTKDITVEETAQEVFGGSEFVDKLKAKAAEAAEKATSTNQ